MLRVQNSTFGTSLLTVTNYYPFFWEFEKPFPIYFTAWPTNTKYESEKKEEKKNLWYVQINRHHLEGIHYAL